MIADHDLPPRALFLMSTSSCFSLRRSSCSSSLTSMVLFVNTTSTKQKGRHKQHLQTALGGYPVLIVTNMKRNVGAISLASVCLLSSCLNYGSALVPPTYASHRAIRVALRAGVNGDDPINGDIPVNGEVPINGDAIYNRFVNEPTGYSTDSGYSPFLTKREQRNRKREEDEKEQNEDGYEGRKQSFMRRLLGLPQAAWERVLPERAQEPGTLILVRHGESLWNRNQTFTGWADADLSEKGVREVEHAAR